MEMRLTIGALGLIGVGLTLRSIRFATKFYENNKIPKSFVKKNIRLRGVVKSVSTDGTINVDHIPIISMPWHRRPNNDRLLKVSLAAITPTISGTFWLKLNVENKIIWFKIISTHESGINCIASEEKKVLFKKNLNIDLVSRGLAVVKPLEQRFISIKPYIQLHKSLIAAETKAKRNKSGVWNEPTKWDSFKDKYLQSFKNLRNVFSN